MSSCEWTQFREFPFSQIAKLPQLTAAWNFSRSRFDVLRQSLTDVPDLVACVAVSGSLNRMEAHSASDLDLLVVVDDRQTEYSTETLARAYSHVWDQLRRSPELHDLSPPKPGGVFSVCASWRAMTDAAVRGIVAEDVTTYGQRMQLLLDSQPVTSATAFMDLRHEILTWYCETRVSEMFCEDGPFHWLWQDVQRYWRSIRARACWLHYDEIRKSLEINLKLRSSRLTLVAAFLLAIATAHPRNTAVSTAVECLHEQLAAAPLERLAAALPNGDQQRALLISYQTIWQHVGNLTDDAMTVPKNILLAIQQLRGCISQLPSNSGDWLF